MKSKYRDGVADANRTIQSMRKAYGKKYSMAAAMRYHNLADSNQYRIRSQKGARASSYERGKAMAFGMYAHTGKKLK